MSDPVSLHLTDENRWLLFGGIDGVDFSALPDASTLPPNATPEPLSATMVFGGKKLDVVGLYSIGASAGSGGGTGPSAVQTLALTTIGHAINAAWSAPASPGSSAVAGYIVRATAGGGGSITNPTPVFVTGLTYTTPDLADDLWTVSVTPVNATSLGAVASGTVTLFTAANGDTFTNATGSMTVALTPAQIAAGKAVIVVTNFTGSDLGGGIVYDSRDADLSDADLSDPIGDFGSEGGEVAIPTGCTSWVIVPTIDSAAFSLVFDVVDAAIPAPVVTIVTPSSYTGTASIGNIVTGVPAVFSDGLSSVADWQSLEGATWTDIGSNVTALSLTVTAELAGKTIRFIHRRDDVGLLSASTTAVVQGLGVPASFIGMHIPSNQAVATVPPIAYGSYRTHDAGLQWSEVETAAGVDTWTRLDGVFNAQAAAGKAICLTLFGTPGHQARADHKAYADANAAQMIYGASLPYSACAPADPAAAAAFVTRVLARHPGKVKFVEVWNEPSFDGTTAPTQFWLGTAAQLVSLAQAVYTATKAADPTIQVLTPGFASSPTLTAYLTAGGGQWADGIAWHPYGHHSLQTTGVPDPSGEWGNYSLDILAPESDPNHFSINGIRALADAHPSAAGKPLYITEFGVGAAADDPYFAAFLAMPVGRQQVYWEQLLAECAAAGVRMLSLYAHGTTDFVGDTTNGAGPLGLACAKIKTDLIDSGLGIVSSARVAGTVVLTMSDGSTRSYGPAQAVSSGTAVITALPTTGWTLYSGTQPATINGLTATWTPHTPATVQGQYFTPAVALTAGTYRFTVAPSSNGSAALGVRNYLSGAAEVTADTAILTAGQSADFTLPAGGDYTTNQVLLGLTLRAASNVNCTVTISVTKLN